MAMIDEARLDDPEAIETVDTQGSLRALATAGAQVRRAMIAAREAGIDQVCQGERPRSVVVASLGGSAVVSDVLDVLAEPGSPVPVSTRRDVPLPGWVGPLDLVVAVTQSGRATGPLALAAEAARRGACLLTVGAADSPLAEVCARGRGVHVVVERRAPSSRAALWSLLTPVLMAADRLGLARVPEGTLDRLADVLDERAEECRPSSESFVNPAKKLALDIAGTLPVVLGDGALTGVAAGRAAAMLARTARFPTTHGFLPDAASQVVACFDGPFAGAGTDGSGELFADPFLDGPAPARLGLLLLRDVLPAVLTQEDVDAAALADAVADSARDSGVRVWQIHAPDEADPVVRLASLMALTDFAATYLAIGLGLDPALSRHVSDLHDRTR